MRAAVRWTRVAGTVAAPETLTVAARDGHVVGFCHGGLARSVVAAAVGGDEPVAALYAMNVHHRFQGHSVGRPCLADEVPRTILLVLQAIAPQALTPAEQARKVHN